MLNAMCVCTYNRETRTAVRYGLLTAIKSHRRAAVSQRRRIIPRVSCSNIFFSTGELAGRVRRNRIFAILERDRSLYTLLRADVRVFIFADTERTGYVRRQMKAAGDD